jgi:hypothetical protein
MYYFPIIVTYTFARVTAYGFEIIEVDTVEFVAVFL